MEQALQARLTLRNSNSRGSFQRGRFSPRRGRGDRTTSSTESPRNGDEETSERGATRGRGRGRGQSRGRGRGGWRNYKSDVHAIIGKNTAIMQEIVGIKMTTMEKKQISPRRPMMTEYS